MKESVGSQATTPAGASAPTPSRRRSARAFEEGDIGDRKEPAVDGDPLPPLNGGPKS